MTRPISISLTPELLIRVDAVATIDERSRSYIIRQALEKFLSDNAAEIKSLTASHGKRIA